ncbi:hypothetical protein [Azospirillum sp. SYSU D00513]|uniref:hypothetical protein n=1 Tax=Azospirillum sp. SYSU D00513 TaxID=2812561 RepID=UPI001A960A83|nr:hypothetical protein [Azospirillum sp. SYSU D00513]
MKTPTRCLLLAAALLTIAGCGKKPSDLPPLPGTVQNIYPNPALDTRPGQQAPGVPFP